MRPTAWRTWLRSARAASTLLFATLFVGSTVLWVRSYFYVEGGTASVLPGQHVTFSGGCGRMCVWFEHSPGRQWYGWQSRVIAEPHSPTAENRMPVFDIRPFWPKMTRLYIAHWLIAVVTGTLAVAPWMPTRWSLRGLFIGVTAIAGLLSFIAWIDRTF